jgi:hypothetical protein
VGEVTNIAEAYSWSITRISEAFELNRMTVRKRLKEMGISPAFQKGNSPHYRLSDVGPALFGSSDRFGDCAGYESPDEMPPTERRAWFQSENERLKFQNEESTLVPDDEVAREMSNLIKAVINPLDGITDTLERKADLTPRQANALQTEIDAIRDQMHIKAMEFDSDEDVAI